METIIASALGALGLIVVALIGLYGARKLGLGQNQEKLVATLKGLIEAQDLKIAELENKRSEDRRRIEALELSVRDLTTLTVTQALEIQRLQREQREQGVVSARFYKSHEGGDSSGE